MSTSLKKYFPAGTPVKWSASAEKFFPSSGEIILNDDTTLNIELKHNFSYDYWVVVEANNNTTSIDRVQHFRVYTKNYGELSLENLSEVGERFYGIRKRDYPDLQWVDITYLFHNGTISKPTSYSSFKQMQIDFGNQEITGSRFPIQTISKGGSSVTYPYAVVFLDYLYIFGGDNIHGYNGIAYICADSLKIFSKVPSDVKFSADENGTSTKNPMYSLYVQNPTGFTTGDQMFSGLGRCSVNIEDFDFSNINDVRYMFNSMYFKDVDSYPLFDTSHITDMSYMFGDSFKKTGFLNLNNVPLYDTSNVTDMTGMFSGRSIDVTLPNFNTANVRNMSYMFNGSAINTTLPNFNTANVRNMSYMFNGSTINTTLPNFNTANVRNMSYMFCGATINTTLPNFNTANVTDMSRMFKKAEINTTLPNMDMSKVTDIYEMFCGATINTTLPNFNTANVTDMSYMFENAKINTTLPNWDTSNVTDMDGLFAKSNIKVFPNWNMSKVTSTGSMFYNCKELTEFRMDMSLVTYATSMFKGCTSLSDLYISNLKTSTDISDCPLTDDSAHFIFFNLQDVTDKTLTVSSHLKYVDNYADLAKSKGWTVALV